MRSSCAVCESAYLRRVCVPVLVHEWHFSSFCIQTTRDNWKQRAWTHTRALLLESVIIWWLFFMEQAKRSDVQYFNTASLWIVYLCAVRGGEWKWSWSTDSQPAWVTVASIVEQKPSWFLNHIRLNVSPWIITNQPCSSWQFSKFPSSHLTAAH